eukprot:GHRQ01008705.1.p1 GENE.GHRQ01008705.1~~GHRQ01008705.1.p1  ORF type:complete len:649 (+),score=233.14 GHRQ01008705.1:624-2570(+)
MFTGPTEQLVPWFTSLGYEYDPEGHGMASDWALDLVSLGFTKPQQGGDAAAAAAEDPAGQDAGVLQAADGPSSCVTSPMGAQSEAARSDATMFYSVAGSNSGPARLDGAAATTSFSAARLRAQVPAGSCMMTSKQELNAAAAAFIAQLQQTQPEWFYERRTLAQVCVPLAGTALPPLPESAGAAGTGEAADAGVHANGHTQQMQLQRTRWWSEAGIHGGAPAPPAGSRWYLPNDAHAAAPHGTQPPSYESSKSEYSATSSKVLLKDQVPSSAAVSAAADPASRAGKFRALSLVQEASPYAEQGLASPASAGTVGLAGGPVGLEGRQQLGLWMRLRWALAKYRALLWRELLITTRNPADVGGRMMTFTYVSAISGLVGWSLPGGADSMFQRLSVNYAVLTFYFLMPFVFMSIFTSDKRFFAADTSARLYHPLQYYLAKVTVTLPFNIVVAIVFHLVYYGMAGMRHSATAMAASGLICVLTGLIGMQAVYCCAIMASSQDLAFVYAIGWTALNLLVNPYMAQFDQYSLGWGWSWLRFVSPCSFAWQGLVYIEFQGRGFDCNSGSGTAAVGLIPALIPRTSAFDLLRNNLDNLGRLSTDGRCVASGNAIVEMYTMGLGYWQIVGILIGFYVLFLVAAYLVVKRSARAALKV